MELPQLTRAGYISVKLPQLQDYGKGKLLSKSLCDPVVLSHAMQNSCLAAVLPLIGQVRCKQARRSTTTNQTYLTCPFQSSVFHPPASPKESWSCSPHCSSKIQCEWTKGYETPLQRLLKMLICLWSTLVIELSLKRLTRTSSIASVRPIASFLK